MRCSPRNAFVLSLRTTMKSPASKLGAALSFTLRVGGVVPSASVNVAAPSSKALPKGARRAMTLFSRARAASSNRRRVLSGPAPRRTKLLHGMLKDWAEFALGSASK
jgi:hypothetical protein